MTPLLGFVPSEIQLFILIALGLLLLFGNRLPEIGRSLGKGIVEFKKGMKGLEDEVESSTSLNNPAPRPESALEQPRPPQRMSAPPPKFEEATPKFEERPTGSTTIPPQI